MPASISLPDFREGFKVPKFKMLENESQGEGDEGGVEGGGKCGDCGGDPYDP